mmetsp:Transcript_31845/g.73561  ORF Transcript_31845/g.73561 Transcript_31845/m.73561 type:complete len:289 (-) Transcript_31845:219-1085(-)|eukprot:CAMPEP_0182578434 /NCGR_PEP_ID=MMETSP1324-20130603/41019_1 /TAXON_ID=236786 /ORGANISM="Florenciella sp., Strain RCC1587" /LENGTH=288 /DNA_ID=CAMNT_0024794385 /DNA_START=4 /DNA_END=870 /DNA_ORIENTATION=+
MAAEETKKIKVVWIKADGVNAQQVPLPQLLNACANCLNKDFAGVKILEGKDAKPETLKKYIASAGLEPYGACPLARHVGLPWTLYTKPSAQPAGDASPTKDKPNMVAVHLALGLEKPAPPEGQGIAKGRALLVADDGADVTPEDLVKLLFFMGDLLMDTLGKVSGDEFETKMENMKLLWAFYGPGVHVQKCEALTRKVGPGPNDVKVFPLEELKKVRQQQEVQNFFRLPPGQMPQFMMQPYLQDVEFLNGLKDIVARKWKPPTEVGSGDDEVDALQEMSFEEFSAGAR